MNQTAHNLNDISIITKTAADLTSADWAELASVTQEAFKERAAANLRMVPCYWTGTTMQRQTTENHQFLIAVDSTRIAGYIKIWIGRSDAGITKGSESAAAVHPDYQGRGIAKKLFAKMEELARAKGCVYLETDTSLKAHSAIRFHLSCGFEKWSYTHFSTANYHSVYFRKYLTPCKRPFHTVFHRLGSWLKLKLSWTETGQMAAGQRIWLHLRNKSELGRINAPVLTLGQIQQVSYDLLNAFISFCEEHHLKYMLCYGTLLGAIRHKGFIPWDDDIDITMPLPDYKRFLILFESNNPFKNYELLYGVKKGIAIPFAMLTDKRTQARVGFRDKEHSRPLAIDIFPAFPLANEDSVAQAQIDSLVDTVFNINKCQNVRKRNGGIFAYFYRLFCNGILLERNMQQASDIMHRYEWGSTQRVRILSLYEREPLALPADCFDSAIDWSFEDITCKIPANYHDLLRENYGKSYMELPPQHQRIPFIGAAYWVSDEQSPASRLSEEAKHQDKLEHMIRNEQLAYKVNIRLFCIIPCMSIRSDATSFKLNILGLPFIRIRKRKKKNNLFLFGILPIASWRTRSIL